MSIERYGWYDDDMAPERFGRWVRYDDHVAEVERLTEEVRLAGRNEDQAVTLMQEALAKVERLSARIPDPDDLRAVLEGVDPFWRQVRQHNDAFERLRATLEEA